VEADALGPSSGLVGAAGALVVAVARGLSLALVEGSTLGVPLVTLGTSELATKAALGM
jgi:hypothetical protein